MYIYYFNRCYAVQYKNVYKILIFTDQRNNKIIFLLKIKKKIEISK